MAEERSTKTFRTDVAALSAGIVAVTISLFGSSGPYGVVSLLVSITSLFLIIGWGLNHPRTFPQRLALASLVGISIIPAAGFIFEAIRSDDLYLFLKLQYSEATSAKYSQVQDRELAISWIIAFCITLFFDTIIRR